MKKSIALTIGTLALAALATVHPSAEQSNRLIPLDQCIPLEDIANYYVDTDDYLCISLKDVGNQLDDLENLSYVEVLENIPDMTEEYQNNMVDMSQVVDFAVTDDGLYLYMTDGSGYYWEK